MCRPKEGLNAHAVLIDELHAQKTRQLWDTLRYAGASRRQPLQLAITTAGYDRHSICWEQHDYAMKVLDGTIEDSSFFAYIAAAGQEDDWTDPEVWRKANPSFGITIDAGQFAEDCREAQESPAKENSFRRYRLNQWTEQEVRWLKMEKWDACDDDPGSLEGQECYAGLDLSSTTDITALVLVFPEEGRFKVLPFFWIPEEGARQRERRDRVPYPPMDSARTDRGHARRGHRLRPHPHEDQRTRAALSHPRDRHRPLERHAVGDATGRGRFSDGGLWPRLCQHELADEEAGGIGVRRQAGARGTPGA